MQCRALAEVVLELRRSGVVSDDELKFIVVDICTSMEIQISYVCQGFVNLYFVSYINLYYIKNITLFVYRLCT